MASAPITSWQIKGEKVEVVTDFIFLGSKITVNCDCSHESKRHLFLGKKSITNLDDILKRRDITLPKKVHRRGWQRMRCLDDITDLFDTNLSKLQKTVKDRKAWCATVHGVAKNWT